MHTATSGAAAARINGITIHSACGFSKDAGAAANANRDVDGVRLPRPTERFVHGQTRMDWQEKDVLVIDEFRPVQERPIILPSEAIQWDASSSFNAEQRYQHDKAHALWRRFTSVVMLDEQMRAAGNPVLQRRIPWETGITVVTPLNRNRWNLNMEASMAFQVQKQSPMRIFMSEHKWKDGVLTEEEAITMLSLGDDSAIPVPAIFMFVAGMPVVVNQNTHQGLGLVNGASYTAAEVVVDKAYPAHRVSASLMIHFGPPAGIILESETTKDLHFVGMPAGTILLTPMSVKIPCQRKRPWQQNDVSRRGLPCAAAFACTDYKVQGGTLERVALELRGTRTANVGGRTLASPCDPYSLYVQLSRCPTLGGIMLVSRERERDLIGNRVPEEMSAAQGRLEGLSAKTVREAASWLGETGG
ncbi:hypothetical protein PLICBS_006546 [Purpureocillium lilacinum]|uniref:uncharacterized protein n=1 Tax=Purpureocillium lilacinum TaxID=33203 RepID=UPI00208CE9BA|nr:hypothetical protein PLICBS_006546 [Purpureocillium lilacinum]